MMGRIDVHGHYIPGVDDGCRDVAESIACARVWKEQGYTHLFCTPHVWPGMTEVTAEMSRRKTEDLQRAFDEAGVGMTLIPGGELTLHETVMGRGDEHIVSMALGGRYILADLWCHEMPAFFEPTVRWLQVKGLRVILAHPERCVAVQKRPELVEWFGELGLLLQGNLQCLGDPEGAPTRVCAERFLREGSYWLLGSDTHRIDTIGPRVEGLRRAIELVGEEAVDRMTRENPRELVGPAVPDGV